MSTELAGTNAAEWRPSYNPWLIALAIMPAVFMEVLDTTITSVALPHIAGGLAASNSESTWVMTSYLVANAIVLPASGWLSLRFGRKRLLLACTVLFTLSSWVCGLAPSMSILILARVLQGAGGGAMQPLAQAILLESFPREKHGMAMAVFGVGIVAAPIFGPYLGGWLTDNYSWRWVFNINIPIGILAFFLISQYVEDPPYIANAKVGTLDKIGFGLLAVWLASLQIVLDKGQEEDWFASTWIMWLSVVSVAAVLALIVCELRASKPFVDLRVFRNRNFCTGSRLMSVVMAVLYSVLTMLPLYMQTLMGYTAQNAGLANMPRGVGSLVALPIAGVLMPYVDSRYIMSVGLASTAAAQLTFGHLTLDVSMSNLILPNFLQGLGIGLFMVPLMAIAVGTLSKERIGNASGIFNLMRNLGGSIGISIATTFLARMTQANQADLVGHLTPYDLVFQERFQALTVGLARYTAEPQARMQAYAMLQGILLQQASLKAYMAMFFWLALMIASCLPGVWLFKKVATKGNVGLH